MKKMCTPRSHLICFAEASDSTSRDDWETGLNDFSFQMHDVRETNLPYFLNISDVSFSQKQTSRLASQLLQESLRRFFQIT